MKTIGIYTNPFKDPELIITRQLLAALTARGVQPLLMRETAQLLGLEGLTEEAFFDQAQIVIVAGGDGTVLRIAQKVMERRIPVLSINLGRVGFLTEVDTGEIEPAVDRLLRGDFDVEWRMMLTATSGGATRCALNEMAVQRYQTSRMVRFSILVSGVEVDRFSADGVIVASPTGSTAYSLSAGGPVLSPHLEALVITPICAHTLHSRPVIVSSHEQVCIRPSGGEAYWSADGTAVAPLEGEIVVSRAPQDALFIRFGEKNFYARLRTKLSEWNER